MHDAAALPVINAEALAAVYIGEGVRRDEVERSLRRLGCGSNPKQYTQRCGLAVEPRALFCADLGGTHAHTYSGLISQLP